jgi:alkylation response protein AidB-like acyl-CoA dehydrogenase
MLLNETHQAIRDMARDFAQNSLAPGAAQRDAEARFPTEAITEMGKLGLMGMLIPEHYDGAGLDYLSMAIAIEEIAAADGSASTIVSVQNSLVGVGLLNYGSEEQKQTYLKPIARGEKLGAFALTEPQAGSDASALRTTAKRDGDHYVLNGSKQFITSGKHADITLVFAVTDKSAGKKGISAFIVPTDTKGYSVPKIEHKLGQTSSDTATLLFEDMRLPASCLLGKEGEGYKIALSNLEGGRIGIAAQAVGMARAALDAALPYAKERQTFGKAIIEHQAVAFRLADMATEVEAARQLLHHAQRRASDKEEGVEIALLHHLKRALGILEAELHALLAQPERRKDEARGCIGA